MKHTRWKQIRPACIAGSWCNGSTPDLPRRKCGSNSRWALWRPCPMVRAYKLRPMVGHQIATLGVRVQVP